MSGWVESIASKFSYYSKYRLNTILTDPSRLLDLLLLLKDIIILIIWGKTVIENRGDGEQILVPMELSHEY